MVRTKVLSYTDALTTQLHNASRVITYHHIPLGFISVFLSWSLQTSYRVSFDSAP